MRLHLQTLFRSGLPQVALRGGRGVRREQGSWQQPRLCARTLPWRQGTRFQHRERQNGNNHYLPPPAPGARQVTNPGKHQAPEGARRLSPGPAVMAGEGQSPSQSEGQTAGKALGLQKKGLRCKRGADMGPGQPRQDSSSLHI